MKFPQSKIEFLESKALKVRKKIIRMLAEAKSGHPGGSLSVVEIIVSLYFEVMRHKPQDPAWSDRDMFCLSKGHACPCWYSVLCEAGYFDEKHLLTLRRLGSILQGHPDKRTPGVNIASGSLGQGLSVALGMSLGLKNDRKKSRVYCIMGDGELQEGNIWEAAMAASHYKADNLCGIVDYNRYQIDGSVNEIMNVEPILNKWESFGWHVIPVNGHDFEELLESFELAKAVKGKPTVIIAQTMKGKGVSFMENDPVSFHGRAPKTDETEKALKELEI
jgi:transketolase